ncbi:RES family NAD+ phosphorylase [Jannaschia sp. M317]|uniref:RES family NAD+ phosphorylase n=1 Tax=Jannaschia sp. M317 TaxID=2867011 RepID=UPI0021A270F2|nr:RES domain-containing protein [Jannaschia sp. M317]
MWRIGNPNGLYPIYDATGPTIAPGRWNDAATPVIYAAEHYATALLERLVHGSGRLPPNQHAVQTTIPAGISYEVATKDGLPGWDAMPPGPSVDFGAMWVHQGRSAILLVPSVVAREERNVLINPAHPDADRIEHSLHKPVHWDRRLFGP